MIPLRDNIPTGRFPVVTVILIALNVAAFAWQLTHSTDPALDRVGYSAIDQSALELGAVPYRITNPETDPACAVGAVNERGEAGVVCQGTAAYREAEERGSADPGLQPIPVEKAAWWITLFTSMFLHGGFLHIGFNMLFLWIFGNNVEDSMGRMRFVAFYLLAGLVAVYSQAAIDTQATAPTIGASGAVAGVLGAYALLFPRARVITLFIVVFFVTLVEVPALILLGLWFALQFLPALGQTALDAGPQDNVAYMAHVGGFAFGLLGVWLFAKRSAHPRLRGGKA